MLNKFFRVEYIERKNIFDLVIDSDHCSSASSFTDVLRLR